MDKVNFKSFFGFVLALSTILPLTYIYVAKSDYLFALYLALSYYVAGSIFVSMPIYYARIFGPEVGS